VKTNDEYEELFKRFKDALETEDAVGKVIRTHIFIENQLNRIIELKFENPGHFEEREFTYFQKVDLAVCLGLQVQYAGPLFAIGEIRNKFGHKLDTELTREMLRGLYQSLSQTHKEILQETITEINSTLPTGEKIPKFKHQSPEDQFKLIAVTFFALLETACRQIEGPHEVRDEDR